METKPPLPPFTIETAKAKVQAAEDAWNTCDPERVALAYTEDSQGERLRQRGVRKKVSMRTASRTLTY